VRIVIDEDIPRELTLLFGAAGHTVVHVEDLADGTTCGPVFVENPFARTR